MFFMTFTENRVLEERQKIKRTRMHPKRLKEKRSFHPNTWIYIHMFSHPLVTFLHAMHTLRNTIHFHHKKKLDIDHIQ